MAAVIAFSLYAVWGRSPSGKIPPFDYALSIGAIAATAYIWWELDQLIVRTGVLMTTWDVAVATTRIILVNEFARRSAGLALQLLAGDRQRVVSGKRVTVRVDLGGRRYI